MLMRSILFLLFCSLFLYFPSFSQGFNNDSFAVNDQVKQAVQLYDQFSGAQANIYNGREYLPYIFKKIGSPFFGSDTLTNGWICYEGLIYQPVPMQYDIARNQVVIANYDKRSKLFLQNEVIDSFHFLNHTFIRLKENHQQNLNNTGFYDQLYNGHIGILAMRQKNILESIKDDELIRTFISQDRFYILKAGTYYWVNKKRDVFRLLNDKKHQIKAGMRQQKIKFRHNNFEEAVLVAVTIYDQH